MCATVCPSQALAFVPRQTILETRREVPVSTFQFGNQTVRTKVQMMAPRGADRITMDAADFIWEGQA